MNTIEKTLTQINEARSLSDVLRIIYEHYMTPRDKELYEIFVLHLQGKPQSDLGILLGKDQCHVSPVLSSFKKRMNCIGVLFTTKHEDIDDLMHYIRCNFSYNNYLTISYLLGGNSVKRVYKQFKITQQAISKIIKNVKKRLPEDYQTLLTSCIRTLVVK